MDGLMGEYRDIAGMIDSDRVDDAVVRLESLIEQNPGDSTLWIMHGMALKAKGEVREALNSLNTAAVSDYMNPWPHLRKAEIYEEIGWLDKALGEVEDAIEINPDKSEFWHEKGSILEEMLIPKEAFECYFMAVVINDSAAWSWFGMARSLVYLNSLGKAMEAVDKAISIQPTEKAFLDFKEYLNSKSAN
ncbi:MAG: hypothetical protein ABIH11_02255 [Candidatus Altiarchaeota archaeon]